MARAHGTGDGGVELDLIGQPLDLRPGPAPGVTFVESNTMTKAPYDGKYELNGHQFRMREGKDLPPGAHPIPDAKAEPAAPENKAEKPPSTKAEKKGA